MANFPLILNLLNFAIKNQMTSNPFNNAQSLILDMVNQELGNNLHADAIDAYAKYDMLYIYEMDILGTAMQPNTAVRLSIEMLPGNQSWKITASFRPSSKGQSNIFSSISNNSSSSLNLKDLVATVRSKANAQYVKNNLQIDQKLTCNLANLQNTELSPHLLISHDQWLFDKGDIVAEDLDELSIINIADNGDVTFLESNRQIPFILSADETVAMIHGTC